MEGSEGQLERSEVQAERSEGQLDPGKKREPEPRLCLSTSWMGLRASLIGASVFLPNLLAAAQKELCDKQSSVCCLEEVIC